ncbi:DegT/DnrJ/EryC1/StrS family aminotransferase [Candidatus Aerophobetes bacterium]|nr:DegT/DnrJ/EryC1/StrS family aminotransferase [Candidatus Aerophobetes bacterium]
MSQKLAVDGGRKAITLDQTEANKWPPLGEEEFAAVKRVMQMPDFYEEAYILEEEFKNYIGSKYALAHNNGTAAIHAALFALGIGPGDEVITPSYTYWATCMPVLTWGGIPVFAEVNPETCNIDPEDIKRRITSKTKAIIVVHLWGLPCEMDEIMEVAKRYNIKVIEDAAHAHGAEYKGKKVGSIGDIGCFSFQASKLMVGIEGGMLVTNNQGYYERAMALGHYRRLKSLPPESIYQKYHATCFGFKYRIHPLAAAIARVQLKHLDERNKKRNKNIEYLDAKLETLPGIRTFKTPSYMKRVYYQHEIILEEEKFKVSKEKFVEALRAEGADVSGERYPLQHQQPIYKEMNIPIEPLPITERIRDKILSLPTFPQANIDLLDQYAEAFKKITTTYLKN